VACGIYYFFWIHLLPKWGDYQIRQTVIENASGEVAHSLVKVQNVDVARWDNEHDVTGRVYRRRGHDGEDVVETPPEKV
jgi:hypothetical protein